MKLKILSDGTSRNTRVINEETGEPLDGVVSIAWSMRAGRDAFVLLEMEDVPAELVGDHIKRYELRTDPETPMSEEPKVGTSNDQETDPDRTLDDVTDEQRERLGSSVPEMPTHRRET
jgi:hypothetical protein